MPIAMVTLDLNDASDYDKVYATLRSLGLLEHTPVRDLRLPSTTLIGPIHGLGETAVEIRDNLVKRIQQCIEREPSRIAVGLLSDWGVHSSSGREDMIEGVY